MTCLEFKELAASYALGALDAAERAACDEHLRAARHEGCLQALAEADEVAAAIPLALPPIQPSPELWGRIAAGIRDDVRPIESAPRRRSRAPWIIAAVGWAAAGAAAAGLLHFRARGDDAVARVGVSQREVLARAELVDRCRRELEGVKIEKQAQQQAVALLERPDTRVIAMGRDKGGTGENATVLFHQATGRAVIVAQGLKAPAGKDYELWVIKGEEKIPAGLLQPDADGRITMSIDAAALSKGANAFAITLEPAGGSATPTMPIVLVGPV